MRIDERLEKIGFEHHSISTKDNKNIEKNNAAKNIFEKIRLLFSSSLLDLFNKGRELIQENKGNDEYEKNSKKIFDSLKDNNMKNAIHDTTIDQYSLKKKNANNSDPPLTLYHIKDKLSYNDSDSSALIIAGFWTKEQLNTIEPKETKHKDRNDPQDQIKLSMKCQASPQ